MYYLESGLNKHQYLRSAIILALVVHAVLILGISFEMAKSHSTARQIEVTLINRPDDSVPDDAKLMAEANQRGSGNEAQAQELTSPGSLPVATSPSQPIPDPKEVLTTTAMSADAANSREPEKESDAALEGINPEVDRLNLELATLEAELAEQTRLMSDQPRVRRLTAASAKQSVDAAYLLDWRRRLEAVGNQYYPKASVRYGIYGAVRLLVIIKSDGTLEDIQVLSSSGFAVLDEAAIKVVRMAAPYSPFPAQLKATTDKLEIIRTWHYEQNSLSSQ
ncbi:MAG: protein TonB [Bacteroidia bacterium]|jgi:protein TonB